MFQRTAFAHYTSLINAIYSNPLIEHCTKTKIADENTNLAAGKTPRAVEIEKLAAGTKLAQKGDHEQLVARLKEAASKVTEWSGAGEEKIMNVRNKEVTLAEMAAMYRLRTLVSISASLVELITRAKTWTKENAVLIEKCHTGDVLPMTLSMFEATSTIGEIFALKSIDRSNAKKEFRQHLRQQARDDYVSKENSTLVIEDARVYIPPLECRINHYRTCVHLIGSALITMIQTYMNSISLEQMDLRTREVKEILDRLPPMYTKVRVMLSFSQYSSKLLQNYPPNKLQFPIAPQNDKAEGSKRRSGEAVEQEVDVVKATGSDKQKQKIVNTKEKIEAEEAAAPQRKQEKNEKKDAANQSLSE